jgi:UDP-3-O-[3-hydroxymyristoyl] glucosamine N-acyltransferase
VLLYIAYLDLHEKHSRVGERRLVRRVKSLMTLNGAPEDELAVLTQARIRTRLTEFKANPVICDAKTFAHVTNVKFS